MRRRALLFIAVAVAYAAGSQLSYSWFGADGTNASFFPAAGVALAALVITSRRDWPLVALAAGGAELALDLWHDIGVVPSLGYVVANLAQALVGASLLLRARPRADLALTRDLVAFLALAVVVAPAVGGVLGATTFVALDDGGGWARFVGEWWIGDGLGVLVVGGTILAFRPSRAPTGVPGRPAETLGLAAAAAAAAFAIVTWGGIGLIVVPLGLLLVSGFRLGVRGVALTGALVSFIVAQETSGDTGYWDDLGVAPDTGVLYLQATLGVIIATAYGVAAAVGERERAAVESAAGARFRALADSAPAMLWVTDDDGRCTYLSLGWREFTGQSLEQGRGDGWLEAVHPDDRAAVEEALQRAVADRAPFTVDLRVRTADDTDRWAIAAGRPLRDAQGLASGFVGSVIDVDERARTAAALRESEARFRALFESIDEGYCLCEMILDDGGRPIDYRFLEANAQFAPMSGLSDAIGRTALELVPDLEHHWVEAYARVALDGQATRFENESQAMGRVFDVFATPVEPRGRFALVFTDITERRRAEEALRESQLLDRRARGRAELLAEVVGEMEMVAGVRPRADRLVELLVPRVADHAAVRIGDDDPSPPPAPAPHSQLDVALDTGGRTSSRLVLSLTDPARRPYGADDMPFVADLAGRAGVLLASARIHAEEHRAALSLQRALLPSGAVRHPDLEVAVRYAAAGDELEVGGDWYETLPLPDGRIGMAVGDVVGHGLEAAATMGRLRTALAALAPHASGPGPLLERLQQFADGPNGTDFATVAYAVLDPTDGALEYASAGHPPVLVVPPDGPPRWLAGGRSMPLCRAGRERRRPQASAGIARGSVLLLYTDGLVERRGESIDVGLERLRSLASENRDAPIAPMCDAIVDAMIGPDGNTDDAVLVCLRLLP